ncbi:protein farnesyltransferase subunit beta [Monosporozyma servazzii]
MDSDINGKAKLLGRRRQVTERILSEEEALDAEEYIDTIEDIMKEVETETTIDRQATLDACNKCFADEPQPLFKNSHLRYLQYAFQLQFPPNLTALDASQPWMLYWIANSFKILEPEELTETLQRNIAQKLFTISPQGGPFGGGVGQLHHIAGTYASINALSLCNNIDGCWDKINRKAIYNWLLKLKQPDGGFKTCLEVGENDTRGVYCALSVASMLNIMTPELCEGVLDYLIKCQTYEGGFGGCPQEDEAHGGYTFCAVASLMILNKLDHIDIEALMRWCSSRQCNEERGFNGRANKLVDGCYSFWVGSTAAILEASGHGLCVNKDSLHEYICQCCQTEQDGGLRDKPGKYADFYHTNYVLLGLAISESIYSLQEKEDASSAVLINSTPNISLIHPLSNLQEINPVYGVPVADMAKFVAHFNIPL